jgi:hypothetical protein
LLIAPLKNCFCSFLLAAEIYERVSTSEVLMFLLLKKHEHSECIINAFEFDFALETTRAKRVP